MTGSVRTLALATATASIMLLASCGSSSPGTGTGGGSPELTITSPSNGASVGSAFDVKWKSNVSLGKPSTGRDHIHLFVDGHSNDYTVVGGNDFTVKDLSPGKHVVDVTLQHADHSSAGAKDQVQVTVTGSGATSPSTPSSSSSKPNGGHGY